MDVQTGRQQPGGSLIRIQVYRAEWGYAPTGVRVWQREPEKFLSRS